MSADKYVEMARHLADTLEKREAMMSSVDTPTARDYVARRYGIPKSILHSLKYRVPKSITVSVFQKIIAAVEHQAVIQIRACENDIKTARACGISADNCTLRALENSLANARFHADALKTGKYADISYPQDVLDKWPGKPGA